VNVLSIGPFPASAVPFQLPVISAAEAVAANNAIKTRSHFMGITFSDFAARVKGSTVERRRVMV
jgi:hypothetical protein